MSLLQEHELSVRSISFDAPHGADQKRIAFVRLVPPPLSWRSNGADQEVSRPSQEPASHLHESSEDRAGRSCLIVQP